MLIQNPPPKWSQVAITWEDILHEGAPQVSDEFIAEYEPAIRETTGWFLGYSNGRVFIALSKDRPLGGDNTDCQAIDVIPEGVIIKFDLLSPKPRRKKSTR